MRRKDEAGESDLYWSVSPSRDFGEPRQLAYKLDTLLINRRIDEAGRPIPKLIRLGSLREICRELGTTGGKCTTDVKMALQQNASAFITAKVSYRGTDGSEQRFEASFTRYSLRFVGQTLPDGRRADAVYIILNDEYWALLNKVQFRPLNYDYLKQLSPGAQRFYEIVSYRIFAAFSQNRPKARMLYSEYCTRAPQRRYSDGSQMRKQMYKIHRPHVRSCYIADVEYRSVRNDAGESDWEILYVPGKKARAEFLAFSRSRARQEIHSISTCPEIASSSSEPELAASSPLPDLLGEFRKRGVDSKKAVQILKAVLPTQAVLAQLQWGDQIIQSAPRGQFRNPPGFYVYLVSSNITPPPSTTKEKSARSRATVEPPPDPDALAYSRYQQHELDRHIEMTLGEEAFRRAVESKRIEIARRFQNLLPSTIAEVARQGVRASLLEGLGLMTLAEFRLRKKAA